MKLSPIVLKLRLAPTRFGNLIAGAAELDLAMQGTLRKDMAFVIPISDDTDGNDYDGGINQYLKERFGVIVALANDTSQADKTGIIAYDMIHDVRTEIFDALLGWQFIWAESPMYYKGSKLLGVDRAYLWYQFDFEYKTRLVSKKDEIGAGIIDADVLDLENLSDLIDDGIMDGEGKVYFSNQPDFDTIYANFILWPDKDLPWTGDLPVPDGFPDVKLPNMATWVDLTENPADGGYGRGFGAGFDFYKILNRS